MYKLVVLCLLTLFFNKDVEEIKWVESRRLQWSDFKGQPDYNSDAAAVTASGISFSYSVKKSNTKGTSFVSEVSAQFYPEHSWFKKEIVNDHILAHEQLHFDITELNVRKFRKRLSEIEPSRDITKVLQREQKRVNKALSEMQNKYDYETNYSINANIQEEWAFYVKSQLQLLYAFRSKK